MFGFDIGVFILLWYFLILNYRFVSVRTVGIYVFINCCLECIDGSAVVSISKTPLDITGSPPTRLTPPLFYV
jgi:hypothetical protein